jgi:hypothetical protein
MNFSRNLGTGEELAMGFWSSLFGSGPTIAPTIHLEGTGEYEFEVVGESFYQDALESICGGRTEESAEHECLAHLICEPENPYDRNAVAVVIDGQKVAHLSREAALAWQEQLRKRGLAGRTMTCDAVIVGGWDYGARGRGHFGVKLDL